MKPLRDKIPLKFDERWMKFGSKKKDTSGSQEVWIVTYLGRGDRDIYRYFGLFQINHSRFLIVSFSSLGLLRPLTCSLLCDFQHFQWTSEVSRAVRRSLMTFGVAEGGFKPPSLGEHFNHCGILSLYNNVLNLLSLNKGTLKNNRNLGLNGVIANNNQSFISVSLTYGSSAAGTVKYTTIILALSFPQFIGFFLV